MNIEKIKVMRVTENLGSDRLSDWKGRRLNNRVERGKYMNLVQNGSYYSCTFLMMQFFRVEDSKNKLQRLMDEFGRVCKKEIKSEHIKEEGDENKEFW